MKNKTGKKNIKLSRRIFTIMLFFNGISALAGGTGLILNPDGHALGMNTALLADTPFNNFLIPGIILLIVNGIGNSAGAILSISGRSYAGFVAAFFGLVLMMWIVAQVALIGYQSALQPIYFFTGLTQLIAAYFFIINQKN